LSLILSAAALETTGTPTNSAVVVIAALNRSCEEHASSMREMRDMSLFPYSITIPLSLCARFNILSAQNESANYLTIQYPNNSADKSQKKGGLRPPALDR
jgi:hypothetical protein